MNISLTEPDGTATKINAIGPLLREEETQELLAAPLPATVPTGSSGRAACPRGVGVDFYARLGIAVRRGRGGASPSTAAGRRWSQGWQRRRR